MKKIMYFFFICGVIGLISATIFSALPAFEMLGRGFLMNIKNGNYEQAYASFSPERQKELSLQKFIEYALNNNLNKYKGVKWKENVTNPDKLGGHIVGLVELEGEMPLPIEFQFRKVNADVFSGQAWVVEDIYLGKEVILRQERRP